MRLHLLASASLAALLSSCASSPPPQPAPAPRPQASAAPAATVAVPAPAPSAKGAPSPSMAMLRSAMFVGHVDAKALRAHPLFGVVLSLVKSAAPMREIEQVQKTCGFSPIDVIDDVWVSGEKRRRGLVVARTSVPAADVQACVAKLTGGPSVKIGGVDGVALEGADEGPVAVARDGFFYVGTRAELQRALAQVDDRAAGSPLAARIEQEKGAVAALVADKPDHAVTSIMGVVRADERTLSTSWHAELISPEVAQKGAQEMTAELDKMTSELDPIMKAKAGAEIEALKKSVSIKASGNVVDVRFGVDGDGKAQGAWVALVTKVAGAAVESYTTRAKTAEARVTVGAIGHALAAYHAEHGKLPASAPRTPAKVPSGKAEQVDPKAWQHPTWKALRFSIDQPQRYAYQVIVGPGGKTVSVVAEGDLDGNGKTSRYELPFLVKGRDLTRGVLIEKDPLE